MVLWTEGPIVPRVRGAVFGLLTVVVFHRVIVGFLPRISYLTLIDYVVFLGYFFSCIVIVVLVVAHRLEGVGKQETADKVIQLARWLLPLSFIASIGLLYIGFLS